MAVDRFADLSPGRVPSQLEGDPTRPKIINIDGSVHVIRPQLTVIETPVIERRPLTDQPLLVRGFERVGEGLKSDLLQLAETNFQLRTAIPPNLNQVLESEAQVRAQAGSIQAVDYFIGQLQDLADSGIQMPDISVLVGTRRIEPPTIIIPSPVRIKPETNIPRDDLFKPKLSQSQPTNFENPNPGINPSIPEIGVLLKAKSPDAHDPEIMSLTERAQAGDKNAFEGLYARYLGPIHRQILRFHNDHDRALDLAQEVFIKAQEKIALTKQGTTIGPWLYRIAKNLAIDQLRAGKNKYTDQFKEGYDVEDKRRSIGIDSFDNIELSADLAGVLEGLTYDQRAVLECRYLKGMDTMQTAQALGKTLDAVKKLQSRGLAASRRMLVAQVV